MAAKKKTRASGKVKALPVKGLSTKNARAIKGGAQKSLNAKGNHIPD